MGQPGGDGSRPLAQVELRKRLTVHVFQGRQDLSHFFTGVARDATERLQRVETAAKLHPHGLRLVKDIFEGHGGNTCALACWRRHQAVR